MESLRTSSDELIPTETTSKNKSIEMCDGKDMVINEATDVNRTDIKTSDSAEVVALEKESSFNKLEISHQPHSVNKINDSLSDMEVDSNVENEASNYNMNKNINLSDSSSDSVTEEVKSSNASMLDTDSLLKIGANTDSNKKTQSIASSDSSENDSSNSSESSSYSNKLETQIVDISDNSESSNSKDVTSANLEKDNIELVDISENAESGISKDVSHAIGKSSSDNSESTETVSKDIPDICSEDKSKNIETSVINGTVSESKVKSKNNSSEARIDNEVGKLLLFSSGELDLSKHSKDTKVNSQTDEAKLDPNNSERPSSATSYSNKLNASSEPKLTENRKKRIYSDDDDDETMSSIEKVSHMDSESMDCEEVSIDDANASSKKTDSISEVVDEDKSQEFNKNKEDTCKGNKEALSPTEEKKPSENSVVLPELSNKETGFPEIFTGLVKVGRYISVKGDFTLRSNEALLESPSLVASYLLKEPHLFPVKQTDSKSEEKEFFHSSAGEFLIGIGISRVNEWFQRDMVRIKKRQIKREGKLPKLEEELELFQKSYFETKRANDMFTFPFKACQTCKFTTESAIVMEGHLLVPHITPRREYQCNFCSAVSRDPREMLFHMESKHRKIGRIQPPVLFYECPFCTFESNSKVKLNSHLSRCQRLFNNNFNQAPARDFEFPAVTPKPITVEMVKSYQKSMNSIYRGKGRAKKGNVPEVAHPQFLPNLVTITPNHGLTGFQSNQSLLPNNMGLPNQVPMPNMNLRPAHSNSVPFRPTMPPLHLPPTNRFYQVVNSSGQVVPMMGNSHLVTSPSQFPPFSSNLTNSGQKKMQTPNTAFFNSLFGNGLRQQAPGKNSDLTITAQLPKLQGPYPVQLSKANNPGNIPLQPSSLVVCEICDGYIKDLEQLRTHMQLIHKVKIHPKMLVSRPPLNCQKCHWRYFTDQGLERHLLGAHGLVTSNMQELSCKNKDAGCCTVCGRVYASKLVSHMNQVHKVTLKPAHLSYKCTVCSATFNLYRLFENHVYLVHSGAAKRPSDGSTSPSKKLFKSIENSEKSDSPIDHLKNHKERENSLPKDSHISKCKDCGSDVAAQLSEKHSEQSGKCEKCLKSDGLLKDVKSCNEELIKKGKECETV